MAMNLSLAGFGNQWLKKVLKIERPWIVDDSIKPVEAAIDDATGYSLPSGGTQKALATFGIYGSKTQVKIRKMVIGLLIFFMAFSGIYLGTHTIYDELAALLLGFLVMLFSSWLMEWMSAGKGNRDILVAVVLCILFALPRIHLGILSSSGISYGLVIGCTLENRYLHFKITDSWKSRLARFAPGAVVLCLIDIFSNYFSYIVPQGYETFAANLTVAFFISIIYPWIFTKYEEKQYGTLLGGLIDAIIVIILVVGLVKYQNYRGYSQNAYKVVAVGGYSAVAPAGSTQALEDAIDIGADCIELDVQETKDGQLVVYSGRSLYSATGNLGSVSSYTYEELSQMDISWGFDDSGSGINYYDSKANYIGSGLLTLEEALSVVKKGDVDTIVRLLDYSKNVENTRTVENLVDTVNKSFMLAGVTYASDDVLTLRQLRNLDSDAKLMYCFENTSRLGTVLYNDWADIFCGSKDIFTKEIAKDIQEWSCECYLADVQSVEDINYAVENDFDGVCTGLVGQAKVITKSNSAYLAENFIDSYTVPTLYDAMTSESYKNFVLQGMTKVGDYFLYSAYDSSYKKNSCLYLANSQGQLMRVFELDFKAHLGGIAYDKDHDLLWLTAYRGQVFAIDWQSLISEKKINIVCKFDAGLYNNAGEHVASFLTIDDMGQLYVGSYCIGQNGLMNQYDIEDLLENGNDTPKLKYSIPTKVQGVTFSLGENKKVYFTQSNGYKNSRLTGADFTYGNLDYSQAELITELPCMVEQPNITEDGLYILFESSARKYRAIYRIPNDQLWLVDVK